MADPIVHIVDDEPDICLSTALVLRLSGLTCATWSSGVTFLEEADIHAWGCAIIDVRMPGIDGFATLKALRERGSQLSVIMASGHGDLSGRSDGQNASATDFITKPYDVERLVARVRELLAKP